MATETKILLEDIVDRAGNHPHNASTYSEKETKFAESVKVYVDANAGGGSTEAGTGGSGAVQTTANGGTAGNASASQSISLGSGSEAGGTGNIAIGSGAGFDLTNGISGSSIFIGFKAGNVESGGTTNLSDGSHICIGRLAGANEVAGNNTFNGSGSISIGSASNTDTTVGSGSIAIGAGAKTPFNESVAIGAGVITTATAQILIGNSTTAHVYMRKNVSMTGLPTSDPLVSGQLWNNGGVLTIST